VEVVGKVHHDACELPKCISAKTKGIVRELTLRVGESLLQTPPDLRKPCVPSSFETLWAST
jgi:hypothetical protein